MNPYKILGVAPTATDVEIRRAFRALVKTVHPDVANAPPDATMRTRRAAWAYDKLKTKEARAKTDAELRATARRRPVSKPPAAPPPPAAPAFKSCADFMERVARFLPADQRESVRAFGAGMDFALLAVDHLNAKAASNGQAKRTGT